MSIKFLYGIPVLACFENDDDDDAGSGGDGDGAGGGDPTVQDRLRQATQDAADAKAEATRRAAEARQLAADAAAANAHAFNQEDVNKFLADDRRKHQEKYKKLETSYQEMLADKNLAAEQRGKLEADLLDLQKTFRTKEQQANHERKQEAERLTTEIKDYKIAATRWENMYKESVIKRSLQDAAIGAEAFNPAQIVGLLQEFTTMRPELDDAGKEIENQMIPMIDFPDVDDNTGKNIMTLRTPQEAVQRMKEMSKSYGNLFRANVVSGIGAGAATGGEISGDGGRVDVTKLTAAQYQKLRRENPEALGLKRHTS